MVQNKSDQLFQAKQLVLNTRHQLRILYQKANATDLPSHQIPELMQGIRKSHIRHGARLLRLQEARTKL